MVGCVPPSVDGTYAAGGRLRRPGGQPWLTRAQAQRRGSVGDPGVTPPREAPSGIRTRVAGLRGRHPRSARRPGRALVERFCEGPVAAGGRLCRPGGHAGSDRVPTQEEGVGWGTMNCDGWARTSILRVTAGRPADWTTSQGTEAAGLEPASGSRRLRGSNALPCQLGHASERASRRASCGDARRADGARDLKSGRRGSRTPKPVRATRFRDGVPRPWQSFPVTPAGVEPATLRLRGGSSAS